MGNLFSEESKMVRDALQDLTYLQSHMEVPEDAEIKSVKGRAIQVKELGPGYYRSDEEITVTFGDLQSTLLNYYWKLKHATKQIETSKAVLSDLLVNRSVEELEQFRSIFFVTNRPVFYDRFVRTRIKHRNQLAIRTLRELEQLTFAEIQQMFHRIQEIEFILQVLKDHGKQPVDQKKLSKPNTPIEKILTMIGWQEYFKNQVGSKLKKAGINTRSDLLSRRSELPDLLKCKNTRDSRLILLRLGIIPDRID